jgi:hypothetical protein
VPSVAFTLPPIASVGLSEAVACQQKPNVRPHADEVVNLFGLAIRHELTADHLKSTMFAHPTGASDIEYMLEAEAMMFSAVRPGLRGRRDRGQKNLDLGLQAKRKTAIDGHHGVIEWPA